MTQNDSYNNLLFPLTSNVYRFSICLKYDFFSKPYLDTEKLASLVRKKRANQTLRDVASEIKISISTISRVESGKIPDMENFLLLCDWLKVSPCIFFGNTEDVQLDAFEVISAEITANKNLDPTIADVLVSLIKAAYCELNKKP